LQTSFDNTNANANNFNGYPNGQDDGNGGMVSQQVNLMFLPEAFLHPYNLSREDGLWQHEPHAEQHEHALTVWTNESYANRWIPNDASRAPSKYSFPEFSQFSDNICCYFTAAKPRSNAVSARKHGNAWPAAALHGAYADAVPAAANSESTICISSSE
jgi:hypothetical protein